MTGLLVALGAGIGAPLRYLAGHFLDRRLHWGTLVVNLIDQVTQKSVWVGLATGRFDKPDQLESKVRQAVAKMFSRYPVRRLSRR